GGFEGGDAARTAPSVDRSVATSRVKRAAVPGAGSDAALSAFWAATSGSDLDLPNRTRVQVVPFERVVDAILVGDSHHGLRGRPRYCSREQSGRGSEVAVGWGVWNLPR